jgi:hypothetical protein
VLTSAGQVRLRRLRTGVNSVPCPRRHDGTFLNGLVHIGPEQPRRGEPMSLRLVSWPNRSKRWGSGGADSRRGRRHGSIARASTLRASVGGHFTEEAGDDPPVRSRS